MKQWHLGQLRTTDALEKHYKTHGFLLDGNEYTKHILDNTGFAVISRKECLQLRHTYILSEVQTDLVQWDQHPSKYV